MQVKRRFPKDEMEQCLQSGMVVSWGLKDQIEAFTNEVWGKVCRLKQRAVQGMARKARMRKAES
jgi:hypothetical protein